MSKTESRRVLGDDVYQAIKVDILSNKLPPGTTLDEVKLMARFGVSRTPVREAIRRLISDELVDMEPHRSAYVKSLTFESITEFFEAYQLIQRTVFILSADRIGSEQVTAISKIEKKITAALKAQDVKAIRKLNDEFYGSVAAGCCNKFLYKLYIKLREYGSRLSAMIHRSLLGEDWPAHAQTLHQDHIRIINALSRKDCEAIGSISDQDVALFKQRVHRALERPFPDSALKYTQVS